MTVNGCCDKVNIVMNEDILNFGNHFYRVKIMHCENCGSKKATSSISHIQNDILENTKDSYDVVAIYEDSVSLIDYYEELGYVFIAGFEEKLGTHVVGRMIKKDTWKI